MSVQLAARRRQVAPPAFSDAPDIGYRAPFSVRTGKKLTTKQLTRGFLARSHIRRPLEEGPLGCEAFARSSIFDLRLQWNHIIVTHFLHFHILDPLKGQSLISHVSCLMSQVLLDCLLYPKKRPNRPQTIRGSGSGMTPESYENPLIFEPVSKATKAMIIGPKATQNHEKSTLES